MEAHGNGDDVDRRALLRSAAVWGAAMVAPQTALMELRAMRARTADPAWLRAAAAWTRHLVSAYGSLPPAELLPEARTHLNRLSGALGGDLSFADRARLSSITAETACLKGWTAMQLGWWGEARGDLAMAVAAAAAGDDLPTHVQALTLASATYSFIPRGIRKPSGPAQRHLNEAIALSRAGGVTGLTRAWMYARVTEERALTRDEHGVYGALRKAEGALSGPRVDQDRQGFFGLDGFLSYFNDDGALGGYLGVSLAHLGYHGEAIGQLSETLGGTTDPLQQAALHTEISRAYANARVPDAAVQHAHQVLDLAATTGTTLRVERMRGVRYSLEPFAGMAAVRDLDQRLYA